MASGLKLEPFSARESANNLTCVLPLHTKFMTKLILSVMVEFGRYVSKLFGGAAAPPLVNILQGKF